MQEPRTDREIRKATSSSAKIAATTSQKLCKQHGVLLVRCVTDSAPKMDDPFNLHLEPNKKKIIGAMILAFSRISRQCLDQTGLERCPCMALQAPD